MAHVSSNTASVAQLNAGIDAVTTSIVLSSPTFTGWPTTYPYWAIIARGTSLAEIVEVTAGTGPTLTATRGRDGTVAAPHNAGNTFEHIIPADTANRAELHIDATAAHGATGAVVGTTNAQTLTSKLYQGGHKHVFTDANPAALTAGYESVADNASARDGFVHRNTGGDVDRRGFLLEQSGTPRVEVFNDGTLKVTPNGSATRKGIETTTSIKAGTTLDVAGASTLTGNTSVGGTLGVTGNTTLSTLTVSGATSAAAITSSGAIAGATVTATNQVVSYGGRAVVAVASSASVASPTTGQVIWDIAADTLKRWSGSAWITIGSTEIHASTAARDTAIPSPYTGQTAFTTDTQSLWTYRGTGWVRAIGCSFRASSNQTLSTGSNKIKFQTNLINSLITVSTDDTFQVPYDGVYCMTGFAKLNTTTSASMSIGGTTYATPMYSGETFPGTTTDVAANAVRFLTASTQVCCYIYNNDGTRNTDFSARPAEFSIWKVG